MTDHPQLPVAVERSFREFWQDIVAPNGTLDRELVLRELHDYKTLIDNVPVVYDHITCGRISKPNTLAAVVIAEADDAYERVYERVLPEPTNPPRED